MVGVFLVLNFLLIIVDFIKVPYRTVLVRDCKENLLFLPVFRIRKIFFTDLDPQIRILASRVRILNLPVS